MASLNWDFPLALDLVAAVDVSDLLVVFGAMLFTGGAVSLVLLMSSLRPERRVPVTLPPTTARIPEERNSPEWRQLDHERSRPDGPNRPRSADPVVFSDIGKPFRKHETGGGPGNRSGG
jgi:hypothetical protein